MTKEGNISLRCVAPRCGKLQTAEGEFCENHYPTVTLVSVAVREKTSPASCRHTVKKGEKYLLVEVPGYRGRVARITACEECWAKNLRVVAKELGGLTNMMSK